MLRCLDHVLVLTDDLEETRGFYCDVLGLVEGERPALPFRGFWLYLGDVACVHLADRAGYADEVARIGMRASPDPVDHAAFAADGYEELVARLGAAGVEATANVIPGAGIRQLFLTDPNGLRVELNFQT